MRLERPKRARLTGFAWDVKELELDLVGGEQTFRF